MSYHNIPEELQNLPNWLLWRLEERGTAKPTKPPYQPNGKAASVTNPSHWNSFNDVVSNVDKFTGIGFVFQQKLKLTGVDLDDTHGNDINYQRQLKFYKDLNSYSEYSPSGKGIHIIVKGSLPFGRRRDAIELYSDGRYFTMTGKVLIPNIPIIDGQEHIDIMFEQMGGKANTHTIVADKEQKYSDDEVIIQSSNAANGEKFKQLFAGHWQLFYASQSEADYALINIICFYSRNKIQIKRIFRSSMLGQRDKAQRDDYLDYMIEQSFDNMLPPVDVEGMAIQWGGGGIAAEPGGTAAIPNTVDESGSSFAGATPITQELQSSVNSFPPGLLGDIAEFFLAQAPRPVPEIALAGAIAFMAGITGRAYNVSGTGLNQYILMIAQTGVGKDAVSDGVSKITASVRLQTPTIIDYKGPGELVSSAGLIKWLVGKPSVLSIVGEFGKKMQEMAGQNANANLTGLSRTLLQMYSKSGNGSVFDPMAYSDKEKNTAPLHSPALSIFGESVPDNFYDNLDESLISDGLLPRFLIFEFKGERSYLNKKAFKAVPSFTLIQDICNLIAACSSANVANKVNNVATSPEAMDRINEFDTWTTDTINKSDGEVYRHLWNRAHLKAHKLAALRAVGMNYLLPVVTLEEVNWAIDLVVDQTVRLIAKFDTGQVGQAGGGENKQLSLMVKIIGQYLAAPFEQYQKYGGTWEMHRDKVITESHISRRLINVSCYRKDRIGSIGAIKKVIKVLLDADDIVEIPRTQMNERYGTGPRSFAVRSQDLFKL